MLAIAFAHGDPHIEHGTVFHPTPGELRVEHRVFYPPGFLNFERRDARRRGIDEAGFMQAKRGEISAGLTLSVDGQSVDRSGSQTWFDATVSGDAVRVVWRVNWTRKAHVVDWGTSNGLDDASQFEATVAPGTAYEVVSGSHVDGRGRHGDAARRVVFRVEPVKGFWTGPGLLGLAVAMAGLGALAARRRKEAGWR